MTDAVETKQNGHKAKGRTVPALPTFTFKDSGVTVTYRRLGPFTLDRLNTMVRKRHPAPEPPLNEVKYGATVKMEPNPTDPDYELALAAYERMVDEEAGRELNELLITYALEPIALDEEAVARYRAMAERFGLPCEGDDREVYLRYIAIGTAEDMQEVIQTVINRSQPTEEAIQAKVESFPADVPRD